MICTFPRATLLLALLASLASLISAAPDNNPEPRDQFDREMLVAGTAALQAVASRPDVVRLYSGALVEILINSSLVNAAAMDADGGFCYMELESTLIDGSTTIQPPMKVTWAGPNDKTYQLPGLWHVLQYMVVGDKWRIYLSHDLHYGTRGNWDAGLPPFSPLVYTIELLQVGPVDKRLPGLAARMAFQRVVVSEAPPER